MNSVGLILCQLQLEGIGLDDAGRMTRIPSIDADVIPRVYAARFRTGTLRFYRDDVPEIARGYLDALPDEAFLDDIGHVRWILGLYERCTDWWEGASYTVGEPPPASEFPDARRLSPGDQQHLTDLDPAVLTIGRPIFAIVVDGHVASTCVSVRESAAAAEAWVQTAPAFRRRGYARQVTAAWAHDVRSSGKIAFYSHAHDNLASRGIARGLGMEKFIDAVGYL